MRDKIARSKKLGTFHCEVWQYHDKEAYKKLQNSVQALLVDLCFDPHQVKSRGRSYQKVTDDQIKPGNFW